LGQNQHHIKGTIVIGHSMGGVVAKLATEMRPFAFANAVLGSEGLVPTLITLAAPLQAPVLMSDSTMGEVSCAFCTMDSAVHHRVVLVRCVFFTMDSAVLGLASSGCAGTVRVVRPRIALEDAIGFHARSREALACM
jgi:pimeloyl-ACP methyl ester carboxylesterase